MGSLYVTKYFKEDSKAAALEMVSEIRHQFERLLDEVDWMDEQTKAQARVKARGMVEHIGYPSELMVRAIVRGWRMLLMRLVRTIMMMRMTLIMTPPRTCPSWRSSTGASSSALTPTWEMLST